MYFSLSQSCQSRSRAPHRPGDCDADVFDFIKSFLTGIRCFLVYRFQWSLVKNRTTLFSSNEIGRIAVMLCHQGESLHFLAMKGVAKDFFESLYALFQLRSGLLGGNSRLQQESQGRFGRFQQPCLQVVVRGSVFRQ